MAQVSHSKHSVSASYTRETAQRLMLNQLNTSKEKLVRKWCRLRLGLIPCIRLASTKRDSFQMSHRNSQLSFSCQAIGLLTIYRNEKLLHYQGSLDLIGDINLPRMLLMSWGRVFRFSSLRIMREKALWASRLIDVIANSPPSSSIYGPSLIEAVLTANIDLQKYDKVRAETRIDSQDSLAGTGKEIKQMFVKGVKLDQFIYIQDRTRDGQNAQIVGKQFQANVDREQRQKFVFLPTFLVTQQIFKMAIFNNASYLLYYGNFGTGKTHSFILYQRLSNLISEYAYKSLGEQKEKQIMKTLKKYYLIPSQARKVIYMNLYSADKIYQELNRSIEAQCPEINFPQKEYKYKKKTLAQQKALFEQKVTILEAVYTNSSSGTILGYVVDQINQAVSHFRDWNEEVKKFERISHASHYKSKQQIDNFFEVNKELQHVVNRIKGLTTRTIYNSPVNIEMRLIRRNFSQDDPLRRLQLDDNHSMLKKQRLPYRQILNLKWGEVSFKHYLWEETALKIRLLNKQISQEKLQYLRLLFCIALQYKECPVYLHALNNRQCQFSSQKIFKAVTLIDEKPNAVFDENKEALKSDSLSENASIEIANKIKAALNLLSRVQISKEPATSNSIVLQNGTQAGESKAKSEAKEEGGECLFVSAVVEMWETAQKYSRQQQIQRVTKKLLKTDFWNKETKLKLIFYLIHKLELDKEEKAVQSIKKDSGATQNSFTLEINEIQHQFQRYFPKNQRDSRGQEDGQFLDFQIKDKTIHILYSPQTFLRLFAEVLKKYVRDESKALNLLPGVQQITSRGISIEAFVKTCLTNFFFMPGLIAHYDQISLKELYSEKWKYCFEPNLFNNSYAEKFHQINAKDKDEDEKVEANTSIKAGERAETTAETEGEAKAEQKSKIKVNEKPYVTQNLKYLFKKAIQNPNKQIFATPYNATVKGKQHLSRNSPSIDFVFLECLPSEKKLVFRTYDITTAENPTSIIDKIKAATKVLELLSEAADESKESNPIFKDYSIKISHTILMRWYIIERVRDSTDETDREILQNRSKTIQTGISSTSWEVKLGRLDGIRANKTDYVYLYLFQLLMKLRSK